MPGYFFFYAITGVSVKYFLMSGFDDMTYLVYSTIGGNLICLGVVLFRGWQRMPKAKWSEIAMIIPSGICTAIVIPTTTLMYTLPISVMVAMVIMRGAIIIVSRFVDIILTRQGLLKKKVSWEENVAVGFALGAVGLKIFWTGTGKNHFAFLDSTPALWILGSYIFAYSIRIYLMNYFKNKSDLQKKVDNRAYFGVEQIVASVTMLIAGIAVFHSGLEISQIEKFRAAILTPPSAWPWAILSGTAFGMVAFFSVFIFMYRGRTATFAGLVNRITSLISGTAATLRVAVFLGGKLPSNEDWLSFSLILIAVALLYRADLKYKGETRQSNYFAFILRKANLVLR